MEINATIKSITLKKELTNKIGWINGDWGPSNQLKIPISDRGLNLGDGIFETILIYEGKAQLLHNHLDRWQRSASILRMATPPSETSLRPLIDEALGKENSFLRTKWKWINIFLPSLLVIGYGLIRRRNINKKSKYILDYYG